MKIAELKTWVVGTPPPHHGGTYWIFLKLTTDNGINGYGEVYGVPFGPHHVCALIEDVVRRGGQSNSTRSKRSKTKGECSSLR